MDPTNRMAADVASIGGSTQVFVTSDDEDFHVVEDVASMGLSTQVMHGIDDEDDS